MCKQLIFIVVLLLALNTAKAAYIFIPMDEKQTDHLKAYGMTYWVISTGIPADWLLNYRGGSFVFPFTGIFEKECRLRAISYEVITDVQYQKIKNDIAHPEVNRRSLN